MGVETDSTFSRQFLVNKYIRVRASQAQYRKYTAFKGALDFQTRRPVGEGVVSPQSSAVR